MPRVGVKNSKEVFVLAHQDYIFHVLKNEQRLVVFKKDEFSMFLDGGKVIAFHKHHKRCDVMMDGKENIMKYMYDTLPFEEYAEFEKWEIANA